jgi:hypothetical protein
MMDAVKFVYHCLKTAEIDTHGLKVRLVSRVLNDNAGLYLGGKFREMLDKGVVTLERTQVSLLLLFRCAVCAHISLQAWIASSVKASVEQDQSMAGDLKPLSTLGARKVIFTGLMSLLFGVKLLHNEQDFPETFLYDVWRLCSLQRKMRVDALALCVIAGLKRLLTDSNLMETENGKLAFQRVNQIFLAVDYGTRVRLLDFGEECPFS